MLDMHCSDTKVPRLTKIYTILILLFPALTVYASPLGALSFGEVIAAVIMLVLLANIFMQRSKLHIPLFCSYLIYAMCSTFFISVLLLLKNHSFNLTDSFTRMIRDGFYFLLILLGATYFDYDYGRKWMKRISSVLSVFIMVQFITYALFKVYIPGIIPQLRITTADSEIGQQLINHYLATAANLGYVRPSGFFSEPAICAHYLTVTLILELFPHDHTVQYKRAFFYSLAILMTFSANAFIALFVCWGCWFMTNTERDSFGRYNKNQFVKRFTVILILVCAFIFIMQNDATYMVVERLEDLGNLDNKTGSAGSRVFRGPAFYWATPFFFKIFGIGFGNFIQFREMYNIWTPYELSVEYMNTNAYILSSTGLIGASLYVGTTVRSVWNKVFSAKMLLLMSFVFGMSSSIYSTPQYVIAMLFMFYAPRRGEKK